ncbi:MAG: hypothetical protein RL417_2520 [Pseudomonadota bacterium]|jgi:hypothetical protein
MSSFEYRPTTPQAAQKIGVVEASLVGLLDKILPEVEHGRVSSLVVDDTGGRAIGLFLHRSLELLGHKLPLVFVCPPGPGEGGKREISQLTPRQIDSLGEHPMIVTEVIYSGEAVGSIVRALNSAGKVPAIASLSGFLVRDYSMRWPITLVTSRRGTRPEGQFSKVFMPAELSFEAQELLCADKITSGVMRQNVSLSRVVPTAAAHPTDEVRREVRAFRAALYRLAVATVESRED